MALKMAKGMRLLSIYFEALLLGLWNLSVYETVALSCYEDHRNLFVNFIFYHCPSILTYKGRKDRQSSQ